MATASPSPLVLAIALPTGPLGVGVQVRGDGGMCTVASKSSSATTPLEVGDVIVSMNGIELKNVEGKLASWVTLFGAFANGTRNLIVHRPAAADPGTRAAAATASTTAAATTANNDNDNGGTPRTHAPDPNTAGNDNDAARPKADTATNAMITPVTATTQTNSATGNTAIARSVTAATATAASSDDNSTSHKIDAFLRGRCTIDVPPEPSPSSSSSEEKRENGSVASPRSVENDASSNAAGEAAEGNAKFKFNNTTHENNAGGNGNATTSPTAAPAATATASTTAAVVALTAAQPTEAGKAESAAPPRREPATERTRGFGGEGASAGDVDAEGRRASAAPSVIPAVAGVASASVAASTNAGLPSASAESIFSTYRSGILAAVADLKEGGGSSPDAIKRHMQNNSFAGKSWLNSIFVDQLKEAAKKGELVTIENSYQYTACGRVGIVSYKVAAASAAVAPRTNNSTVYVLEDDSTSHGEKSNVGAKMSAAGNPSVPPNPVELARTTQQPIQNTAAATSQGNAATRQPDQSAASSKSEAVVAASSGTYRSGILAAVEQLKDRTGSSSFAIKKHMQANLPEGKQWCNAVFLSELKKAATQGDLVKVKSSYKLSVEYKKKLKCLPTATKAAASSAASSKKHALRDSTKHNAGGKKRKTGKKEFTHDDNYMKMLLDGFPKYGAVSPCMSYYISLNNDSYNTIADRVGLDDWKKLNTMPFNRFCYGILTGRQQLQKGTIVKIPTALCSKWKLNKLVDNHVAEVKEMATCSKCHKKELPDDPDPMLMCDGCDLEMHTSCAGLTSVPTGDWLCEGCLRVMEARRQSLAAISLTSKNVGTERSLEAKLPPLAKLDHRALALATSAQRKFIQEISMRKSAALDRLEESQRVLAQASRERIADLQNRIESQTYVAKREESNHDSARIVVFRRHGLCGWRLSGIGRHHIHYQNSDGSSGTVYRTRKYSSYFGGYDDTCDPGWHKYYRAVQACLRELDALPELAAWENAKQELETLKEELNQAKTEEKNRPGLDCEDQREVLLKFATLLSEPKLYFENQKSYQSRAGKEPLFLGIVKLEEQGVRVLNILREPEELVIAIPVSSAIAIDADLVGMGEEGEEYYIFGTDLLFSADRNDCTPMDFSPTSTRTAQRDLHAMLVRDQRNKPFHVSEPVVPSSVELRGTSEETLGDIIKCFDLSELVQDCKYPIQNKPRAQTPKLLADNGLVLRDYQKTSLQWLLDKEQNPTGLGSAGEIWTHMRGREASGGDTSYFYSELTGTFAKDIFDYQNDVLQKDASGRGGDSFPSSAIIGSEMGLGKTVIALSLVVANPPSLLNRVLPREHIAKIEHPAYLPPPSVARCTSCAGAGFLSNGTLVIAPMTLCPQWQSEIERFAPWMSLVTLHNDEKFTAAEIASKEMVIVSTFVLSQPSGKTGAILRKLRSIHFHRIFLDESHYNNTGERVKLSLAQLSSTHRYCVTGTPVGHSLADLYGQLRFLRVPQFCRPDFWQRNVGKPYSEHNCYSLNVIRSLLSRMVIRHSKDQTLNGESLVALPPRNVETLLLPFGSEEESNIYEYIETRNRQRFMELRSESPATVLGKFMELQGMMHSARVACGHTSLVNLDSLQKMNVRIEHDRLMKERQNVGYGRAKEEKKTAKAKTSSTRADVLQEAIKKARPSAQARMRETVLSFQEGEVELMECPICLEATGERDVALTPCAHKFCAECILSCMQSLSSTREPHGACPECRDKFTRSELTFLGDAEDAGKSTVAEDDNHKPEAIENKMETNVNINGFNLTTKDVLVSSSASGANDRRVVYEPLTAAEKSAQRSCCHTLPAEFLSSWNRGVTLIGTKVARLVEEIKDMIQKDPTSKAVVFSQFLGTLDVAGQELIERGIGCARVDGMMKQYQRADAIDSFTNDPNTRVLLLSMRAGAAGLNLMAANHCFLMDPAMNSAVEEQAIDRIHRIGQTRPVFVKRLIIKDSIEERILSTRRALAADRPTASTQLDGAGLMEAEEDNITENRGSNGRHRRADEGDMAEQKFERLRMLEQLYGYSATLNVTK